MVLLKELIVTFHVTVIEFCIRKLWPVLTKSMSTGVNHNFGVLPIMGKYLSGAFRASSVKRPERAQHIGWVTGR
jgi:hypothetical protein